MPFPPHLFTLKNISLETITNDIFRILLGFTGCYVVLFVIWHFVQWKQDSWLQNRAVKMGGYTLDIYLLNIVILEMVGGEYVYPWLIRNVFHENILQAHGFFFETVSTFVTVCVMMEIIILVSRILNYWSLTAKFFFFRDTNKPCHVIVVSSHNEWKFIFDILDRAVKLRLLQSELLYLHTYETDWQMNRFIEEFAYSWYIHGRSLFYNHYQKPYEAKCDKKSFGLKC